MRKGKHMNKKTNQTKDVVANTPATTVNVEVQTKKEALKNKELVMGAKIPKDIAYSSEAVIINQSQNRICLYADERHSIELAPREIKSVPKDLLREVLKNPMVQRFFDKGVVTHNIKEGKQVSAHEAVAPERLKQAVERHDGGQNVVAEVKKFEREGSFKIDLE